jgi:hypothetical protein
MAFQGYEEVLLPPAKTIPPKLNERLVPVPELEPLAKGSFPVGPVQTLLHGHLRLNRDIRV